MFKHVNLSHEVDPGMAKDDVRIEKTGANSYKVYTKDPKEIDLSRHESRAKNFDQKFIDNYNKVAEHEDRFELDQRDTRHALDNLRKGIENGDRDFHFKVRE